MSGLRKLQFKVLSTLIWFTY